MLTISYVLIALSLTIAYTVYKIYANEKDAQRNDILFACGSIGRDLNQLRHDERAKEVIRLRMEARRYMTMKGYPFDYTEADKQNEARRKLREEQLEEARLRFQAEHERQKNNKQAEIILFSDIQKEHSTPIVDIPRKERGISVLYPKNSDKYQPPMPPRPKPRSKFKKRDGSSKYALGLDISPVYGIKNQPAQHQQEEADKTLRNEYPSQFETYQVMEDDYPNDIEQIYQQQLEEIHYHAERVRYEQRKQEIKTKPVSVQDYFENVRAYDALKEKLSKAI